MANGDPPSDVLLGADVYPPTEPAAPALVRSLKSAAQRAKSAGYPSKVAVVQSEVDLGNLVQAFNKPQQYADYLAADLRNHPDSVPQEFALLVVMPAGAGIAGKGFNEGERKAARTINVRSGASSGRTRPGGHDDAREDGGGGRPSDRRRGRLWRGRRLQRGPRDRRAGRTSPVDRGGDPRHSRSPPGSAHAMSRCRVLSAVAAAVAAHWPSAPRPAHISATGPPRWTSGASPSRPRPST